MKIKEGFVLREVCGDNVVCSEKLGHVHFGHMFVTNETATFLWQQAVKEGNFTIESLMSALCEAYDISEELARKDVTTMIAKWQELDMVEE
jgi:hypothetical protein